MILPVMGCNASFLRFRYSRTHITHLWGDMLKKANTTATLWQVLCSTLKFFSPRTIRANQKVITP